MSVNIVDIYLLWKNPKISTQLLLQLFKFRLHASLEALPAGSTVKSFSSISGTSPNFLRLAVLPPDSQNKITLPLTESPSPMSHPNKQ